jgi:hypothetical protein
MLEAHGILAVSDLLGVGQILWEKISFDVLSGVNMPNTGAPVADPTNKHRISTSISMMLQAFTAPLAALLHLKNSFPQELRQSFSQRTSLLLATLSSD